MALGLLGTFACLKAPSRTLVSEEVVEIHGAAAV
jgi:hypothetical protein